MHGYSTHFWYCIFQSSIWCMALFILLIKRLKIRPLATMGWTKVILESGKQHAPHSWTCRLEEHLQIINHSTVCFWSLLVHSLWHITAQPPPGPVHLPVPADVTAGRGHVLHGPPAPTACLWGAGGLAGCLPDTHKTAAVGLLDLANHAVTGTHQRGRHGGFALFITCSLRCPT